MNMNPHKKILKDLRRVFIALFILLPPSFGYIPSQRELNLVWAGEAGTAGTNFVKVTSGAKPAALADSYTARTGDPQSMYFNPAGLAGLRGVWLSFSRVPYLVDTSIHSLALVQEIKGAGVLGLALGAFDGGALARTTEDVSGGYGGSDGRFRFMSGNLDLALARKFRLPSSKGFLSGGVKMRSTLEKNDDQLSQGFSVDLGMLWANPSESTRAGMTLQNIGGTMGGFRQPLGVRAGLSQDWKIGSGMLTGAVEAVGHVDSNVKLSAGIEMKKPLGIHEVMLRTGYRFNQDLGPLAGLSAGVGYGLWTSKVAIMMDYSFSPQGLLGSVHRMSLTLGLGQGRDSLRKEPEERPDTASKEVEAPDYWNQGRAAFQNGNYELAAELFEKLLPEDDGNADLFLALGNAYYKLQSYQQALQAFQIALDLKPGDQQLKQFVDQYRSAMQQRKEVSGP